MRKENLGENKRVMELINKQYLNLEEIGELEESEEVDFTVNCGYSGVNVNYIWYAVKMVNGEEYSVYCIE